MPRSNQTDPLEESLQEIGLPSALELLGKNYRFEAHHGSHHTILVGTIQAVEISDEGGTQLYVSSPRFWGKPLVCLAWGGSEWMAYAPSPGQPVDQDYFSGELSLLL